MSGGKQKVKKVAAEATSSLKEGGERLGLLKSPAKSYLKRGEKRFGYSVQLLSQQATLAPYPFTSTDYQLSAMIYCFHYLQLLCNNLFALGKGIKLLGAAIFDHKNEAVSQVSTGLAYEFGSVLVNLLNAIVAVISWITRTITSLIYGYMDTQLGSREEDSSPLEKTFAKGLEFFMQRSVKDLDPKQAPHLLDETYYGNLQAVK